MWGDSCRPSGAWGRRWWNFSPREPFRGHMTNQHGDPSKSVRPSLRGGQDCGMADKQWFAVRTIVANNEKRPWGPTNLDPGQIDYEERITIWRTESAEQAIALAEAECQRYVDDLGGDVLQLTQCYALAMKPGHGVEVFSLIRRSEFYPTSTSIAISTPAPSINPPQADRADSGMCGWVPAWFMGGSVA